MFYDMTWLERALFLKRIKGGGSETYEVTSTTGIFETDMTAPLKELLLSFTPFQSGSGDTSPSNIRPISGWTECVTDVCGKNLYQFLKDTLAPTSDYNGFAGWCNGWEVVDRTKKYTYSVYIDNTQASNPSRVTVWLKDKNNSAYVDGGTKTGNQIDAGSKGWSTITIDLDTLPNTYYLYFGLALKANGVASNPMVEVGTSRTDYEPYNGTSYTTDLGQTVYGGTLDVTTGELTVTWSGVIMDGTVNKASNCRQISDTSEYTYLRGYYVVDFVDLLNTIPYNSGESICSHFTWYSYSSRRAARPDSIYFASSARVVYWCSSEYTTLEEFNGYLQDEYAAGRPVTLVYPRGSSTITYQLTPQEIETLKGMNVIASDAEVTEVVYLTHQQPTESNALNMSPLSVALDPMDTPDVVDAEETDM